MTRLQAMRATWHARPDDSSGRLRDIALDEIHPNLSQPRKRFDQSSLAALSDSIRERGVLQPIIVQPRTAGGYELVAGERRWRASRIAGIATIPALVAQPLGTGQSIELALIENVARQDLGVIEEARTIAALLDELNVTATTLARRLGRSRSDLAHTVRLLDLPDDAIELINACRTVEGAREGAAHRARTTAAAASSRGVQPREAGRFGHSKPRSRGACDRALDRANRIPIRSRRPRGCTTS